MAEAAPAGDGEEEAPGGRGWVCTGNGGPGMPVGVQCHLGLQLGREAALGGWGRRGVAQAPAFSPSHSPHQARATGRPRASPGSQTERPGPPRARPRGPLPTAGLTA